MSVSSSTDKVTSSAHDHFPLIINEGGNSLYSPMSPQDCPIEEDENVVSSTVDDSPASPDDAYASRFDESTFLQNYELNIFDNWYSTGMYSIYRPCTHRISRRKYAVKIVPKYQDCSLEIELLRASQGHPNIIELHEVHEDFSFTYIIVEAILPNSSLRRRNNSRLFREHQTIPIMRQVASALSFLHSKSIVNFNIKPDYLEFVNADPHSSLIKIIDFSSARKKRAYFDTSPPEPQPMDPELVDVQGYDECRDMWNLGYLMYWMMRSNDCKNCALTRRIACNKLRYNASKMKRRLSEEARKVLRKLLTKRPVDRITASEFIMHPWLQSAETQEEERSKQVGLVPDFRLREVDDSNSNSF